MSVDDIRSGSQIRLQQYRERAGFSEELQHLTGSWHYIPVHHFEGPGIDAYWCHNDGQIFLQAWTCRWDGHRSPGLYARMNDWEPPTMNLIAVVPEQTISEELFERVMTRFSQLIMTDSIKPSVGLELVGEWDDV